MSRPTITRHKKRPIRGAFFVARSSGPRTRRAETNGAEHRLCCGGHYVAKHSFAKQILIFRAEFAT